MPIIWVYRKAYVELGPIFRIRMPEFRWHYVVVDPKLARLILDGDKTCKGADKTHLYKRFDSISFGYSVLFTKLTYGDGWDWARKGIAPGFIQTNFQTNIERFCCVVNRAASILDDHISNNLPFDISLLITRLTFDMLTIVLFQNDYNTLLDPKSPGNMFLEEDKYMMKEFGFKQVMNPIRWLMFWDKDLRRAYRARGIVYEFLRHVLNDYVSKKTAEEIAVDKTFLGLLTKRYEYGYEMSRFL